MLHSTLSIGLDDSFGGGDSGPLDPDAEALIGRMTVPPSAQRKRLISDTIVALKAAGVWALLDLLYVFAAHDAQAGLLNWKAAVFNATAVAGPSFIVDRGYAGNGSTAYIATGWGPTDGVQFQQDSAHMAAWVLSAAQGESVIGNTVTTGARSVLQPVVPGNTIGILLNDATGSVTIPNAIATGLFLASRSGASAIAAYRNGSSLGSDTIASSGLSTGAVTFDRDGGVISTARLSQASLGASLNATQAADYYAALLTYMQAVGAV